MTNETINLGPVAQRLEQGTHKALAPSASLDVLPTTTKQAADISQAIEILRISRARSQEEAQKCKGEHERWSLGFHEGIAHSARFAISLLADESPEAKEIQAEVKAILASNHATAEVA